MLEPSGGLLGADVAFPVLHGPFGEDGTVQGLLELLDVPYVGAGVMASAVSMDKAVFKDLMAAHGIPQVDYVAIREGGPRHARAAGLRQARAAGLVGGDIEGLVRVRPGRCACGRIRARPARAGGAHGGRARGGVLGARQRDPMASQPGEIVLTESDWYDYEAKYKPGGMELVVPGACRSPSARESAGLQSRCSRSSTAPGMARVDFFVEDGGRVLVNELNTIPGFTSTSVYAKLFDASGVPYGELLDRLLALALERHEREGGYRH